LNLSGNYYMIRKKEDALDWKAEEWQVLVKEKQKKEWQVARTILNSKGKMDLSWETKETLIIIIVKENTKTNDR